jgi:ABC-type lipoprotein release transport system permease subunit
VLSRLNVLVQIALRNLFGSLLNLFVGAIIFFGTVLLVVGGSIFDTLDHSLSKSIVGSTTGHMQIYSSRSKDSLEIYGKIDGSDSMLSPIDDFPALKEKLLKVPNVSKVVPMGTSGAMLGSGNTVDLALSRLRGLYRDQLEGRKSPELAEKITRAKDHVRQILKVLLKDAERQKEILAVGAQDPAEVAALVTTSSDEFWTSFDQDPYAHLELLENKISPQVADADLLFIRYLGTDLDAFQTIFDRMEIVDGQKVPEGKRGLLLPKFFYEEYMKLKNARRLDKIRDARDAGRKIADASDKELQRYVRENKSQTREFVLQLDSQKTAVAVDKLQRFLKSQEADFQALLVEFFQLTDDNFDARYKFFYAELAPMLDLYRVKVGDVLDLKSFGRSGAVETVNVRVYGTFDFKGLEKSPLAGALGLIDMVSFRDLYGFMTSDREQELKTIQAEAHTKAVSRENAEADLFGGGEEVTAEVKATHIDEATGFSAGRRAAALEKENRVYSRAEIESGVVLHAAIILADDTPRAMADTQAAIAKLLAEGISPPESDAIAALEANQTLPGPLAAALAPLAAIEKKRKAGDPMPADAATVVALEQAWRQYKAKLDAPTAANVRAVLDHAKPKVWVIAWDQAAGTLGQFIGFFRGALVVIVLVVGLVAVMIMMIGVTIATLRRTQMIGTLRAIGAQRELVLAMIFVETLALGIVFAALGIGVGALIVSWLHATGIPATKDELYFFFSGPKLLPSLTGSSVVFATVMILAASLVSVLVPAIIAVRVSPLRAMQAED